MDEKTPEINEKKEETAFQSFKASLWEFLKFFTIAALIVIPIRVWVAQPFIVNGASMVPTYENGEYLIVDELSYQFRQPQRGEVIIFRYPKDTSKFFIKRIIGLPEENLQIKNNKIYIFSKEFPLGVTIDESYIGSGVSQMADMSVKLSANEYFVMGDNRSMSSDSRYWGPVEKNLVIGRAWLRLWPFNKLGVPQ